MHGGQARRVQEGVPRVEQVVVEDRAGRSLRGFIDSRSDDDALWLRIEEGGITLRVPMKWEDITTASIDGVAVAAAGLKRRHASLGTAGSAGLFSATASPPGMVGVASAPTAGEAASTRRKARARNLEIPKAKLTNLDADVEPDGICLELALIGDDGLPMPVRGSVRARLYGERWPQAGGPAFSQLEEWAEPVREEAFQLGTAAFTLPFRSTAPEWEFDLMPDAILNVELGAFGHGNFSASTPVVVRPFNPMRDDLQLWRNSRFFPAEMHGPPARQRMDLPAGRWMHWTW